MFDRVNGEPGRDSAEERELGRDVAIARAEDPVQAAALNYLARGFSIVPVHKGGKKPIGKAWQNTRMAAGEVQRHFPAGKGRNIGLLTGSPSGGLVDIDLDCLEAIIVADSLLPPTGMIHGRPGARRSHRFYRVGDPGPTQQFHAPDDEKMLLEVRGTGSQTVVPPSIHPIGDALVWEEEGEPATIDLATLLKAAKRVAAAATLARSWPTNGGRQKAALALQGGLARAGWDADAIQTFVAAVAEAAGDEEADKRADTTEYTVTKHEADEKTTGWPTLVQLVGDKVVDKVREWLGCREAKTSGAPNASPNQATSLVKIVEAAGAELFHDDTHVAYAAVRQDGRRQTMPIGSQAFQRWLTRQAYLKGSVPGRQVIEDAVTMLTAKAEFEGPERKVYLRVADYEGKIYLDLGDPTFRAVEVTSAGWSLVDSPPVYFLRPQGMGSLPEPVRLADGDGPRVLGELRRHLGLDDGEDWKLAVGWLLAALNPSGAYPVLFLYGPQGAAKTSAAKTFRSLIDPNGAPVRQQPKDSRDLSVQARNNWVLAYDNVSTIPATLSDTFCSLATGTGFSSRQLYTDGDEFVISARRPVMLNGIALESVTRPDLLERIYPVELPEIRDEARRDDLEVEAERNRLRPQILGALLDAAATGLRRWEEVRPGKLPRMANAARWVEACAPALGWRPDEFIEACFASREDLNADILDQWSVYPAIARLLEEKGNFDGTTGMLWSQLEGIREGMYESRPDDWPRSAKKLGGDLRRHVPHLRRAGIEATVALKRTNKGWPIRLSRSAQVGVEEEPARKAA
jgi:hypothetical protein